MRKNYFVNWCFATQLSLQKVVKEYYQHEVHRWPLLRGYKSEGFIWHNEYLIIVLRFELTSIPYIGKIIEDDGTKLPDQIPDSKNIEEWQNLARNKYSVSNQDAVIIIPIKGDGPTVEDDWQNWGPEEQQLWHRQISYNIQMHFYLLKGFDKMGNFILPPGYRFLADQCERFFVDHPHYEKNVFVMTRFVENNRLLTELDTELRKVIRKHNLNPLRADDKMYMPDRNLWNNVCVYMLCSKCGIAILEDRIKDEFNPNVALEYGFMRALNKPVLLLADDGFRNLRADIIGTLREEFDITDIKGTISAPIEKWLSEIGVI